MQHQNEETSVLQAFLDDPVGFYVVLKCGREYEVIDRLTGQNGAWLKLQGCVKGWVHLWDVVAVAYDAWESASEAQA
jgi:hypothetical protein